MLQADIASFSVLLFLFMAEESWVGVHENYVNICNYVSTHTHTYTSTQRHEYTCMCIFLVGYYSTVTEKNR